MSTKVENLDNNKVKITFEISPEKFEEGIKYAYNKNKSKINIQGFRKGKVPRKIIEMNYGKEIFYEEALNHVLPEAYEKALAETGLDVVPRPDIDVETMTAEDGAVINAEVYLKPEAVVKDYKGIEYKKKDIEATDEEIDEEIDKSRKQNSRIISIEDRPTQKDDIVIIDFKGYVDDEEFEGGEADDFELVLGSNTFIDNFEEQLIGKNIDDFVEVHVTFPDDYGKEELCGKPAKFEVTIKEIKYEELPEVNDEFAQDVSEFDNLDEYKNDIKAKIEEKKIEQASALKEEDIIGALIERSEVDIPGPMIEIQVDSMIRDFAERLRMQGMSFELYMQYTGATLDSVKASYRPSAEKQIKGRLCLEAVARAENIAISDQEIEDEIERIAESYKMEKEELIKVMHEEEREGLELDLKVQKALQILVDSAVEVE